MAWPFALLLVFGFFASIAGSLWLANPPEDGLGELIRRHWWVRVPVRLLGTALAIAIIGGSAIAETSDNIQQGDPQQQQVSAP